MGEKKRNCLLDFCLEFILFKTRSRFFLFEVPEFLEFYATRPMVSFPQIFRGVVFHIFPFLGEIRHFRRH